MEHKIFFDGKTKFPLVFLFFCFAILSLFSISVSTADFTVFNTSFILMIIGLCFGRNKTVKYLFLLAFFVNLSFISVFSYSYYLDTGLPFLPGGDSQEFVRKFIAISNGDYTDYWGRYKLFLAIYSSYYEAIKLLEIGSESPYHTFILSSFFGAFIAPLTYLIGKKLFNRDVALKAALLTVFFPLILQFNTTSLRVVVASPFMLLIMYQTIKTDLTVKSFIISLLSFAIISSIRLDWAGYIIVFLFFYYTSNLTFINLIKSYFIILIIVMILVFSYLFIQKNGFTGFRYYSFERLLLFVSDVEGSGKSGSLSAKLVEMGILGRIILLPYVLFYPVIPPVLNSINSFIAPLLISFGSLFWWFSIPLVGFSLAKKSNDLMHRRFVSAFIMMTITVIILVAFTSIGSFRHKLFIYPIAFIYLMAFRESYSAKFKLALLVVSMTVFLGLAGIYVLLKA